MPTLADGLIWHDESAEASSTLGEFRARLVAYRDGVQGDPPALNNWAQQYRTAAQRVEKTAGELYGLPTTLSRDWTGVAYQGFADAVTKVDPDLAASQVRLTMQATTLDQTADLLRTATAQMEQIIAKFDATGRVVVEQARNVWLFNSGQGIRDASRLGTDAIRQADAIAKGLDAELGKLAAGLEPAPAVAAPLPPGTVLQPPWGPWNDPKDVFAWWNGMSPAQRQEYIATYPQQIGALNGIPAIDRNAANRTYLRQYLNDPANAKDEQYGASQKLYDKLVRSPRELLLLGFDPKAHDGRAIVAVGNPDTATHTVVLLPGVGNALKDVPGLVNRAENVAATAANLTNEPTSAIFDLGYDTPETSGLGALSIVRGERGEQGAVDLTKFVTGLDATHQPGVPGSIGVIAHSYGNVVAGNALKQGMRIDNLVTVGSPGEGYGITNVSQLNMPGDHVYVLAHADDPVSEGAGYVQAYGSGIAGAQTNPIAHGVLAYGTEKLATFAENIHGSAPQDPAFGANVVNDYEAPSTGFMGPHSSYFDPDPRTPPPNMIGDLTAMTKAAIGQGGTLPLKATGGHLVPQR